MERMTLRAYAERALDMIEGRALYADRVDWPSTRVRVLGAADRLGDPGELHDVLRAVVRQAGGPHSGLLVPPVVWRPAAAPLPAPVASVIEGAGVVLVLPAFIGDRRSALSFAKAGGRALRSLPPVRGWVVDVRGNGGGSMWPMLAVAAPLLRGDGAIGASSTVTARVGGGGYGAAGSAPDRGRGRGPTVRSGCPDRLPSSSARARSARGKRSRWLSAAAPAPVSTVGRRMASAPATSPSGYPTARYW